VNSGGFFVVALTIQAPEFLVDTILRRGKDGGQGSEIHTPEEYAPLSQVNSTGRGLHRISQMDIDENNLCNRRNLRINVCDAEPYEFNTIIQVFKQSGVHPNRPVIPIPMSFVWLLTRIAGFLLPKKRKWLHSGYEKLIQDLVFGNTRIRNTGFTPTYTLETLFIPHTRLPSPTE